MKKFSDYICNNTKLIMIISLILLIFSIIGFLLTKVNYDILVYLPSDIETVKGQETLTNEFKMGAYSIAVIDNMNASDILKLEDKIKNVEGVNEVVSLYDVIGTSIPIEMFPSEIKDKVHNGNSDLLMITFNDSTSAEETLNAVEEIRNITDENVKLGGMSSMVLDTMNLSNKEITIYIIIAVILCIIVLELSLDNYLAPFILLLNIGFAILVNLGTNIFLGNISYITKALVAVLQLGVTTDFSIFLYHSYQSKKQNNSNLKKAMSDAIKETFSSVTGSSLTTIAGFLVLCTMSLTLGKDLGIVMAKGVLLGLISVLTLYPSLLLIFDKLIDKTKHKSFIPNFSKLNKFIIKYHIAIFVIFIILLIPMYLAYKNVDVYYKMDKTLPNTLDSIKANEILKDNYNIVSPEIILINNYIKNDDINNLVKELENIEGIDLVLSYSKLKSIGITEDMLPKEFVNKFENNKYQVILINSLYDIASDELNEQIVTVNDIVKKYDDTAILAGEGPLMKDLIKISDTDFNNVNISSIVCIFIILFIVLKSFSLPFLLIITILFAIFNNMGISYFSGTVLPFVAPIVLGTIQLGATIDYAILMTSTYLEKRKNGMDKNSAMLDALNYSGESIFVSGLCFFAATFGVGLYSDLEMVGSLCTLISRGAIISMLVVITILPSILLIFDKLIFNTTFERKDKKMKKIKNALIITSILFSLIPINSYALEKNETVYSKLNYDGTVKNIIVNEKITNVKKDEKIEDYTTLDNILNLGNNDKYYKDGFNITWETKNEDILYQGTTDKKLPISVFVTYKLNGENINLEDLLGKSGKIDIILKYENTSKYNVKTNNKNETLYTPFVVSLGTMIPSNNNKNVKISNGKVINNGNNYIVIGIASPGLYNSLKLKELKDLDTITISYETTKFELSSIYSIITNKVLDNNDLKIFDKMDNLYNNIDELQNNMNKIENGSKEVKNGSKEIKTKLEYSLNELKNNNSDALSKEDITKIKNSTVNSVKEKFTLDYKNNIANKTWDTVKNNLQSSSEVTDIVKNSITNILVTYLQSVNEYNDYVNCETANVKISNGITPSASELASCTVIQSDTTFTALKNATTSELSNTASKVGSITAEKVSKEVASSLSEEVALETASNVAESLSLNIANNVKNASIKEITNSLTTLYNGITLLDNGINDLSNGISTYNKEGINKISDIVNKDVKVTEIKLKELNKLANNYSSFAGKSSIKGDTKFILEIEGKKVKEENINEKEETKKVSLWERIKNLFK